MRQKVLVVGGAGYIGSHTCLLLAERGYEPVVFDNLSNGHEEDSSAGAFRTGRYFATEYDWMRSSPSISPWPFFILPL